MAEQTSRKRGTVFRACGISEALHSSFGVAVECIASSRVNGLLAIDREVREQILSPDDRHVLRHEAAYR